MKKNNNEILLLLISSLCLSPFWDTGFGGEFFIYGNKVSLNYDNMTYNNGYVYSEDKITSDVYDISKAFIEYFGIQERPDCVYSYDLKMNLVTQNYLNSNFSNWTTGTVKNGNYYLTNSSNSGSLTGMYLFDPNYNKHTIYLTDTGRIQYNYGVLSHELAHYWFKRKCFNEGYYNEFYAINFHEYFMSNYNNFINNTLMYGE